MGVGMTRLRWKKKPKETGLRSIGAGPRGSVLHDGVTEYAWVNALGGGWRGKLKGWYWISSSDAVGEWRNTCNELAQDEATAKAQAMAFVKEKLACRS